MRNVNSGRTDRVRRHLFNIVAILSLLAAVLLLVAGCAELPGRPWMIGSPARGWLVVIDRGTIAVDRFGGGAFVSVPFSASLGPLAIPFALLTLACLVSARCRGRHPRLERGFLVEPISRT
jgi:hypothetical protein